MKKMISFLAVFSFFALTLSTSALAVDFYPGQEIKFMADAKEWSGEKPKNPLTTNYYSIAEQEWNAGKELVAGVSINNDQSAIILKLKPDYLSTTPKPLAGTIKVRAKGDPKLLTLIINCTVGNLVSTIDIQPDGNIDPVHIEPNTVYTVTATANGYPHGKLTFNTDIADVSVRVYDKDKLYLEYSREPNNEILLNNSDSHANMDFLNFKGRPTFSSMATLTFYGTDSNSHLYEVRGKGLTKLPVTWDRESNSLVYKTRSLGSYVLSDVELKGATAIADPNANITNVDPNPNTGTISVATQIVGLITVSGIVATMAFKKKKQA